MIDMSEVSCVEVQPGIFRAEHAGTGHFQVAKSPEEAILKLGHRVGVDWGFLEAFEEQDRWIREHFDLLAEAVNTADMDAIRYMVEIHMSCR